MSGFLNWATNTTPGCYVMGSLLGSLMVMLSLASRGRLMNRVGWTAVVACAPGFNLLTFSWMLWCEAREAINGVGNIRRKRK